MADWDDDDYEPQGFAAKATDKWEGEDEEDEGNVKDNWFDEDEGEDDVKKPENTTTETTAFQVKKKRSVKAAILEKEKQMEEDRRRIAEMKLTEEKTVEKEELTPEEELAEKRRQQKLVEESDLKVALETFGATEEDSLPEKTIDGFQPTDKEEFAELSSLIVKKLSQYEAHLEYVPFLDALFRDLCASLDVDDIKKLGTTLNVLASEKLKQQKGPKAKKKGKKVGATIKAGKTKDEFDMANAYGDAYQDDFLDGFM